MNTILFALWFFLPAGAANAAPIIAAQLPWLAKWTAPMDFHKTFRDRRLFGSHKTWRGLIAGIVTAIIVVSLQQALYRHFNFDFIPEDAARYMSMSPVWLGFLFGFGALMGDALESLAKRQFDVPPGGSWFPFDQIDYIIGGCLATALAIRLEAEQYAAILAVWFVMHVFFSYVGYIFGLKPKPI